MARRSSGAKAPSAPSDVAGTQVATPPPAPVDPVRIVDGTLSRDGDKVTFSAGGVSLDVYVDEALPADAEVADARRRAMQALGGAAGGRVLLRARQRGGALVAARLLAGQVVAQAAGADDFARVRDVIARRGAELYGLPGVIAVRPGYRFRNGWIIDEPCIVAIVSRKVSSDDLPAASALPARLDGVTVDVAPATPVQQLLASAPSPQVTPAMIANPLRLALPGSPVEEEASAESARTSRYVAPPDAGLNAVNGPMNVICHTSPDAGWPTLKAFLAATRSDLRVAMYDFTAPHIVRELQGTLARAGRFELVLDPGLSLTAGGRSENPKSGDWTEDDVRAQFAASLGGRFSFVWAAVHRAGKTDAGIFPTAYHIKVAVRDGAALWLSSGNWQSSNQPNLDPLHGDGKLPRLQQIYNREWHVVVDSAELARTYERFIAWDASQAASLNTESAREERPDVLVDEEVEDQAAAAPRFFAPKTVALSERDSVQPLLTPDNYADFVIPVIEQATSTLRFQNQYINIGKDAASGAPKFLALLDALKGRVDAGVDVRIILRDLGNTRAMLEALKVFGIDPVRHVRLQPGCHNKGIIVDDRIVCLGSHNWSADGTSFNRDASLIFQNPKVVAFYTEVFDYDWGALARQRARSEIAAPQIASDAAPTPVGKVRLPWDAYFGDDERPSIDAALAAVSALQPSLQVSAEAARAANPGSVEARAIGDLRAAKAEASRQFLPKSDPNSFTAQAAGISPVPEMNVVAVGIGEKVSDGLPTGAMSVKLFVRRKYPAEQIAPDHLLPTSMKGLPVDVEQIGDVRPLAGVPNPRVQITPAQPGCSVGFAYPEDASRMAGTFGALVRGADGRLYILSNNHVLADQGRLQQGAPIYQTGLLDLAPQGQRRRVAQLSAFAPLSADPLHVDAALALADAESLVSRDVLFIGTPAGLVPARIDMVVHKFGRTSGYTAGRVVSTSTDITVGYETGSYTFTDQILIIGLDGTQFSDSGDSGSLILERQSNLATGLLFAGSATHTVANHLSEVFAALNVNLA